MINYLYNANQTFQQQQIPIQISQQNMLNRAQSIQLTQSRSGSVVNQVQDYIITSSKTSYLVENDVDLGQGTFGAVKRAIDTQTNQKHAIKIINKDKVKRLFAEKNIRQELTLHSRLNHKNILKFYEYFEDKNNIYIVLEYCSNGNLHELLKSKQKLTEREVFPIFFQLVEALQYLSQQGIVHRDIKPANILFHNDNTLRICDYNWAQKVQLGNKLDPVFCGTTEYMPPEVLQKQQHDYRVDIWSLGIVLYEMIHGDMPFKGSTQKEKINNVLCSFNFRINQELSLDLQMLIHSLLSRIVDSRPSYNQIIESKWVQRMISESKSSKICSRSQTTYRKVMGYSNSDRLSVFSNNSSSITNNTSLSTTVMKLCKQPSKQQFKMGNQLQVDREAKQIKAPSGVGLQSAFSQIRRQSDFRPCNSQGISLIQQIRGRFKYHD